jgi:hypothetical protein
MSEHLSQEQFEACVLGRAGQPELEHIGKCAECQAEVEHFRKTMSLFRSTVWDRVDERTALESPDVMTFRPAAASIPMWRWALVSALFVTMIVIPLFLPDIKQPERSSAPVSSDASAEVIMERLNRHLLRTVPEPMEPAMSLIPSDQFVTRPGGIQ